MARSTSGAREIALESEKVLENDGDMETGLKGNPLATFGTV